MIIDIKARMVSRKRGSVIYEKEAYERCRISKSEYNRIWKKQNGKCAICLESETQKGGNEETVGLAVDHCHETGKIRGLLCSKCNRAIGLLKDSIDNLERAISYLEEL